MSTLAALQRPEGEGCTRFPRFRYGYARVSTTDQNLDIQEAALKAAGCEMIRSEKVSGTTTSGRAELQTVLEFLVSATC